MVNFESGRQALRERHQADLKAERPQAPLKTMYAYLDLQRCPTIMAQHPKIESIGSVWSIILGILEVQVYV